jgi:hypothetical protein
VQHIADELKIHALVRERNHMDVSVVIRIVAGVLFAVVLGVIVVRRKSAA